MDSVKSKTGLKRKHVTLTISNKLKVIEQLERGVPGKVIAAEFGISRQTVSDIKKRTESIKAYAQKFDVTNDKSSVSKRKTLKRPKEDVLESALYKWYTKQKTNGVAVHTSDLQTAAENLTKQLGLQGFTCSSGWLCRFRYRHNINRRDSEAAVKQKSDPCSSREAVKSDERSEEEPLPVNVIVKEEEEVWDNELSKTEEPTEPAVLNAARDGIDAVIAYVGYSSNRELWSHYEQLRTVREIIIEEQKKIHVQSMSGCYIKPEFNSQSSPTSESSFDE